MNPRFSFQIHKRLTVQSQAAYNFSFQKQVETGPTFVGFVYSERRPGKKIENETILQINCVCCPLINVIWLNLCVQKEAAYASVLHVVLYIYNVYFLLHSKTMYIDFNAVHPKLYYRAHSMNTVLLSGSLFCYILLYDPFPIYKRCILWLYFGGLKLYLVENRVNDIKQRQLGFFFTIRYTQILFDVYAVYLLYLFLRNCFMLTQIFQFCF